MEKIRLRHKEKNTIQYWILQYLTITKANSHCPLGL